MKRKTRRFCLPAFILLLVTAGLGRQGQPSAAAVIRKISILPSRSQTRIVLESDAPLSNVKTVYSAESPLRLVVELGKVQAPELPPLPAESYLALEDLKVQTGADQQTSLVVSLKEPVPWGLESEPGKTVIEIPRILRSDEEAFAAQSQAELGQTERSEVRLGRIGVEEKGDGIEVTAPLGQIGQANVFALESPLRLVVDLFDTIYDNATLTRPVGKFGLESIRVGQFQTPPPYFVTRMVFEIRKPCLYLVANGPKGLAITFVEGPGAPRPRQAASPSPQPEGKISKPAAAAEPSKPQPKPQPKQEPKPQVPQPKPTPAVPAVPRVKAENKDAESGSKPPAPQKPEEKPVPPKVPPALTKVEPEGKVAKTVTEGQTPAKPEPIDKAQKAEDLTGQEKLRSQTIHDVSEKYSGDMISPKFKDAELRDVVLWLGERVGVNVIFDPGVRGTVTCNLVDVPWDQFLDLVLKNNKQGRMLEGNVLRIAPVGVLAEEEKSQQTLRDAQEQSGPLMTKTFTLSYAKAKDILGLLQNKKSMRGEIVTDDRTNTLIVTDVKEKIGLLDNLIAAMDTPTPQVQIETRIVEATTTFVRDLGIQWGYKGVVDPFYGNQTSLEFPNKILLDGSMIPQGIVTKGIGGPLGGYAVNLPAPASNAVVGFSLANVLDTFRLDVALSALETSGNGRIVSSQRVTAQNNKEAYINQGRQIPVQTQANFTVTTTYVNAGLELKATPQITAEGTIIMTLDIQNNAADFANLVNGIPPITTQSAKTTVGVPDGGTTVIGGIYRIEDAITRQRVPFLHQIPLLGNLFKSFSKTTQNRELLIFITPRILK